MKYFSCLKCGITEVVSNNVDSVTHYHGHSPINFLVPLSLHPEVEGQEKFVRQFLKELKFETGKCYLVLYDPRFLNSDELEFVDRFEDVEIILAPCEFKVQDEQFVTETVSLESLEQIEEWLATKKLSLQKKS